MKDTVQMTDDELRDQLITSDFGGKDVKSACLNELLKRSTLKGAKLFVDEMNRMMKSPVIEHKELF